MVFGLIHKEDERMTARSANWGTELHESPKLLACLVNLSKGKIHTLSENEISIGRSSVCEIVLNDDATVSRRHAVITMIGGDFYLQDLGSRNGTVVNGEIVKNTRMKLKPEDKVSIGKTCYAFSPIGISEALYGSQIKEITVKSRVALSSNAARQIVADVLGSVKKIAKAAIAPEKIALQAGVVSIRK